MSKDIQESKRVENVKNNLRDKNLDNLRESLHFLTQKADISAIVKENIAKMHPRAQGWLITYAIKQEDFDVLKVLIEHSGNKWRRNAIYEGALEEAMELKKIEVFKSFFTDYFLKETALDESDKEVSVNYLLYKAFGRGDVDFAKILLEEAEASRYRVDYQHCYYVAIRHTDNKNESSRKELFTLLQRYNKLEEKNLKMAINKGLVEIVKLFTKETGHITEASKNSSRHSTLFLTTTLKKFKNEVEDPFHFGIELETCVIQSKYDPDAEQIISTHFEEKEDGSIKCSTKDADGEFTMDYAARTERPVEFVYKETFKRGDLDLPAVRAAFNKISQISVSCGDSTDRTGEQSNSCSTHVHMSHEQMTLKMYPNFRVHLQQVWGEREREISERFYKGRVFNTYCKNLSEDGLCTDSQQFSKYQKLNLMPSIDDTGDVPIHVEFRGWGASIVPGANYPFDLLKEYLGVLIEVWNEAKMRCESERKKGGRFLEKNPEWIRRSKRSRVSH